MRKDPRNSSCGEATKDVDGDYANSMHPPPNDKCGVCSVPQAADEHRYDDVKLRAGESVSIPPCTHSRE